MSRLFLSYSRADAASADRLYGALAGHGHDVWMDKSAIQSGAQWRRSIVEAIERSDRVLLLLSRNSATSDHVRREIDIAHDAAVPILPLTLDEVPVPTSLRYQIAGIQRHDLSRDFEEGIGSLLGLLAEDAAGTAPANAAARPLGGRPRHGTWVGRFAVLIATVLTAIALYASNTGDAAVSTSTDAGFVASPFAVYLFLCAGIFALFHMTESLLRRPVLEEIGDWLTGDSLDGQRADRPQGFISMFDAVFKVRHVSKRIKIPGFWRSCFISLAFALLLFGMFTFAGIDLWTKDMGPTFINKLAPEWAGTLNAVLFTILIAILFNVLPDYVSIIESRYVLEKIERTSSPIVISLILAVDTVFTVCIAFAGSVAANVLSPLAAFVMTGDMRELANWQIPFDTDSLLGVYMTAVGLHEPDRVMASVYNYCMVFIYSTFFTSAWIWLYLGAGLIVKAGAGIERFRRLLLGPFRVKERPLSVLGWLCIVGASAGFWSIQLGRA